MSATTTDRDTPKLDDPAIPTQLAIPLAAATIALAGTIACCNAAGNAVPGSASAALKAVGCFASHVDNSAGVAGDKVAVINRGVFFLNMGSAADALTIADRFATVYVIDNQTVGKTDGTGTRSAAGRLIDVVGTQAVVAIGAGTTL